MYIYIGKTGTETDGETDREKKTERKKQRKRERERETEGQEDNDNSEIHVARERGIDMHWTSKSIMRLDVGTRGHHYINV